MSENKQGHSVGRLSYHFKKTDDYRIESEGIEFARTHSESNAVRITLMHNFCLPLSNEELENRIPKAALSKELLKAVRAENKRLATELKEAREEIGRLRGRVETQRAKNRKQNEKLQLTTHVAIDWKSLAEKAEQKLKELKAAKLP